MTRDPLRAFRVDDFSWSEAQKAAKAKQVTVSEVLRAALREFVDDISKASSTVDAESTDALGPRGADVGGRILLAQAQGILMARHALGPEQAAARLEALAAQDGSSVLDAARSLVRPAPGRAAEDGQATDTAD